MACSRMLELKKLSYIYLETPGINFAQSVPGSVGGEAGCLTGKRDR
jgi:hypothetical protein